MHTPSRHLPVALKTNSRRHARQHLSFIWDPTHWPLGILESLLGVQPQPPMPPIAETPVELIRSAECEFFLGSRNNNGTKIKENLCFSYLRIERQVQLGLVSSEIGWSSSWCQLWKSSTMAIVCSVIAVVYVYACSLSLSLWCVCDDIEHIIIPAKLSATSFFNELIVNYDWLGVHWTSQSCVLKTVSLP
jgi:hypothetical protein